MFIHNRKKDILCVLKLPIKEIVFMFLADFIEDKERQGTPSPFTYDVVIEKNGVSRVSNFRTTVKGGVGLMNKQ